MNRNKKRRIFFVHSICISITLLSGIIGCKQTARWQMFQQSDNSVSTKSARQQLKLLMPSQLEILPFTKPRSWDSDYIPDGIEVVLRPLDSFGDQTKAVGTFRFELYKFKKAHADPRGDRLAFWQVDLNSKKAQNLHWDKITRTYTFRLGWTNDMPSFKPGKYVLEVTYISPWNERISARYIFTAKLPRERMKREIEQKQKSPFKIFR